jgi:outer membrane protein assembly factor BamE (lipoprotein component of BamABCDE complex)
LAPIVCGFTARYVNLSADARSNMNISPDQSDAAGRSVLRRAVLLSALLGPVLGLLLGGCGASSFTEQYQRGYILAEGALEQLPVGATQEQVLIVLGTPSTVATVSGEAFYYISQRTERAAAFLPYEVKDQRVVAVYFDKNRRVERLANYGLKDGKLFDFISQTTKTGGEEYTFLGQIFRIIKN